MDRNNDAKAESYGSGNREPSPTPIWLRQYGGIVLAIIASLCVPLVYVLPRHYVFSIYFVIVMIAVGLLFNGKQLFRYLVFGTFLIAAYLVIAPNFIIVSSSPNASEIKQNTHAIQMAIERYAVDNNGLYPLELDKLKEEAYMPVFPNNYYTDRSHEAWQQELPRDSDWLRMYELGSEYFELGHEPLLAGNFIYLPQVKYDSSGEAYVDDYLLVSFCETTIPLAWKRGRRTVNEVALVLTSGNHKQERAASQPR